MTNSGRFDIITDRLVRDARTEIRVLESNRDRVLYAVLLLGAVLMLLAVMY